MQLSRCLFKTELCGVSFQPKPRFSLKAAALQSHNLETKIEDGAWQLRSFSPPKLAFSASKLQRICSHPLVSAAKMEGFSVTCPAVSRMGERIERGKATPEMQKCPFSINVNIKMIYEFVAFSIFVSASEAFIHQDFYSCRSPIPTDGLQSSSIPWESHHQLLHPTMGALDGTWPQLGGSDFLKKLLWTQRNQDVVFFKMVVLRLPILEDLLSLSGMDTFPPMGNYLCKRIPIGRRWLMCNVRRELCITCSEHQDFFFFLSRWKKWNSCHSCFIINCEHSLVEKGRRYRG